MATFKEQLASDVGDVFLNLEEFGELHTIDDREMAIIIDNNELLERQGQGQYADGIYAGQKLIYVAAADFGPPPAHGSFLTIDDGAYTVVEAVAEGDIYAIVVEANRAL